MAEWATISSLATAGGTLVLAVATFSSVRSANRSARAAERSLQAGLVPVLIPSHEDDRTEVLRFGDGQLIEVPGHGAGILATEDVVYLGIGLRNGGSGLAVLHGWRATGEIERDLTPPPVDSFRLQQLDLYIPAGDAGFWLGRLRDRSEAAFESVRSAVKSGEVVQVDLLYGDYEGGQRTITRFLLRPWGEGSDPGLRAMPIRYWNLDRADPRQRPEL